MKFEKGKLYKFDIHKYKKDMKKRIKRCKDQQDKALIKKTLQEGLAGFAKELNEGLFTFSLLDNGGTIIGLYTYNNETILIYPEWCKEVK